MKENRKDMTPKEIINKEIDSCGMAYKIKDSEGNQFVFAGLENGFPVYRCKGGRKHIFDLTGYEVIEKYIAIDNAFNNRLETILYNAINLLIDETFEEYEDSEEWFAMILKELETTPEELSKFGINLTVDGGI